MLLAASYSTTASDGRAPFERWYYPCGRAGVSPAAPPLHGIREASEAGAFAGEAMRVSFSTGTLYHRRLGYSLALARRLGFDGVELALGPGYLLQGLGPLDRKVRRAATPVLSVHPPVRQLPGWPRAVEERVARVAEAALRLGAPVAVTHILLYSAPGSPREARFAAALRRARELADGQVALTIETSQYSHRRRRFALDDVRALVDFAGAHDCGITLDTCHTGANREDLWRCLELVRPLLRNIHLSDMRWQGTMAHTHLLPGEGELPLGPLLASLARDGYDGLVTVEVSPFAVGLLGRRRAERRLGQALAFVRAASGQPYAMPATAADG